MKKVIKVKKNSATTDEKIRYIDLFCGLGAFHAAFNTSKHFECVLACDIDEGVRKIYEANYGLKPHGDIRKLDIPNMPDLQGFFGVLAKNLRGLDRVEDRDEYLRVTRENSKLIREKVLKYLMVRRTRREIIEFYGDDLAKQKMKFPKIADPKPIE